MGSKSAPSQRKTPKAGVDYPRNYAEFMAWFSDDAACLDYLDWIRWKDGFECPSCHGSKGWRMKNKQVVVQCVPQSSLIYRRHDLYTMPERL
ncbi:hypothetical protein BI364_06795 [Acidihalobacter yilgarnensis]|uniref:Transposase zinc-ribbon domain-containing protein n=1 Tax=Acidihalobacter yilgarnensis TaxID=2819280 RepID=A0A1D8IMQ3_9GAMM|nr:hypothetical protein BI364_06795 [Acidihalobacter yilgarnensis]